MQKLQIIKIGGKIAGDDKKLGNFLEHFTQLDHPKLLVHGGGNSASKLCEKLDIPIQMNNGRRITDEPALNVAVMVYAGLINKKIVANLQGNGCNALGLSGADLNIIPANKRCNTDIDYGLVGDIEPENIDIYFIKRLLDEQAVPVFSAITHDTNGQLLNTNADTIASVLAIALSQSFEVTLTYCFEKIGVLHDIDNDDSLIAQLTQDSFANLKQQGVINDGMVPKLDTAFAALSQDIKCVNIKHANNLTNQTGTELAL
jgi:acetylglutamate kinase